MKNRDIRAALGFVVAPMATPIVLYLISIAYDGGKYTDLYVGIGAIIAYAFTILFCVPIYFSSFRGEDRVTFFDIFKVIFVILIVGSLISFLGFYLLGFGAGYSFGIYLLVALIPAEISAFLFWLIAFWSPATQH